ncbi:DMT family transporter [Paenibacillus campinasensis]|uniref:EamA family transporter n=1 Tax=Paenibacillus campinasensis TaxID=66347 RepID=A0A268ETV0_9BACL|nr:EamA family transporter [Paenibacillus campinasensis]PAD76556.1 EamA family transporter [Paenibacillus campinasensis]
MILLNYILMCAIFSTTFLAIKVGVEAGLPPFFAAGFRFFTAGLLIMLWMIVTKKIRPSLLLRKDWILVGLTSTFATFATLYWAEQYVDSGVAAVLSATGPMMILMLQTTIARKSAKRSEYWGAAIGFAGVCVLIMPKMVLEQDTLWILSCVVILIGELGYCIGSLLTRKLTVTYTDISPIAINSMQMIYGGLALFVLSVFTERIHIDAVLTWPGAGSMLYLTLIGSMVGHSLYAWLLKATNAFFPSTWLFISPMVAVGLGFLFYNEAITLYSLLGSILIVIGIVVMNLGELTRRFGNRGLHTTA